MGRPQDADANAVLRLQWSRFFSKRKILDSELDLSFLDFASMEPLFFKAENRKLPVRLDCRLSLQWSRFFSKRKILSNAGVAHHRKIASMEPLFFKAENAERAGRRVQRWRSFNGAAFFQSGKSKTWRTYFASCKSFNGAAFFQSGKSDNPAKKRYDFSAASMEPLFFKAENRRVILIVKTKPFRASMEPLFFKAENLFA